MQVKEAYDCLRYDEKRKAYDSQSFTADGFLMEAKSRKLRGSSIVEMNMQRYSVPIGPKAAANHTSGHFRNPEEEYNREKRKNRMLLVLSAIVALLIAANVLFVSFMLSNATKFSARRVIRQFAFNYGGVKDYYSILGVPKSATQRQIKSAYYQLSKKFHPDVAGEDVSAKGKFLDISEAWECLRDPNRRNAYDNQMSGGGGRYPGDDTNPFRDFQRGRQGEWKFGGNPFHNRQFTEEEYRRVWEQFNRMRTERERYDSRMNWQRQRNYEEFERQRAQRWKDFHDKYPDGPPGSFRWQFKWDNHSRDVNEQRKKSWEMLKKMTLVYFAVFFLVTILRVFLLNTEESSEFKKGKRREQEAADHEKIRRMIDLPHESIAATNDPRQPVPFTRFDFMSQMPEAANLPERGSNDYTNRPAGSAMDSPQNEFQMYKPPY